MKWLIGLYPAWWRRRYAEEFREVLDGQAASVGMFLDVVGGAVDAHLHPEFRRENVQLTKGDETMTSAMLTRCLAGGPKPTGEDRRQARFYMRMSALFLAVLYLVLTKIFRSAPAVQALGAAAFPAVYLAYQQTANLRGRPGLTQALVLAGGVSAMYVFMLGVCLIAERI
jgi:hypothetical protein